MGWRGVAAAVANGTERFNFCALQPTQMARMRAAAANRNATAEPKPKKKQKTIAQHRTAKKKKSLTPTSNSVKTKENTISRGCGQLLLPFPPLPPVQVNVLVKPNPVKPSKTQ